MFPQFDPIPHQLCQITYGLPPLSVLLRATVLLGEGKMKSLPELSPPAFEPHRVPDAQVPVADGLNALVSCKAGSVVRVVRIDLEYW